jgi:hypothetical protein
MSRAHPWLRVPGRRKGTRVTGLQTVSLRYVARVEQQHSHFIRIVTHIEPQTVYQRNMYPTAVGLGATMDDDVLQRLTRGGGNFKY